MKTVELLRGGLSVEACITDTTYEFINHPIVDIGDISNVRPSGSIPSILLRCGVCVLTRIKTVHWEDAGNMNLSHSNTSVGDLQSKEA